MREGICLDPKHLGPEHAGARYDHAFLGERHRCIGVGAPQSAVSWRLES